MPCLFCLPWFRRRRRQINQPDTAPTSLLTLPPELLLMIADELDLDDAANFALINRRLSVLLGPIYWPQLRTDVVAPRYRRLFLETLARDLPSWFYCDICLYLHRFDRVSPPGLFDEPSKLLWCSQDVFADCPYGFGSDRAQFAVYLL